MLELIGFFVVVVAAAVYLSGLWLFARAGGTPLPFAPPRELVVKGPFRYTRNPLALSVVAGAAGLSLALRSPGGALLTALLAVVLHLYISRREEPVLSRRFGEAYVSYCKRVPRWVPRLRREGRAGA
jgi:protein-S-isoprenylcysteine O-methyltransferase Ste14